MNMTYRDLMHALSSMTDEQLNMNVSVVIPDLCEATPVSNMALSNDLDLDDVLDPHHPCLVLATGE